MGVREYDPALGRFISLDPLKGEPTEPQQRNRYPYVGNNPMMRYDLNGMTSSAVEEL
jgi:RHS repeat-associated protein